MHMTQGTDGLEVGTLLNYPQLHSEQSVAFVALTKH